MRSTIAFGTLWLAALGCGGSSGGNSGVDAAPGNNPPPRILPGGGIGDGPIDGVANLYVIDELTRAPIANAQVQIGTQTGTTDSTGLFVAHGVMGAQTVAVKQTGYKSALWIGANGANMTIDLTPAVDPAPTSAQLSGSITGFGGLTVASGHIKTAIITYSQSDGAPDYENNLATANGTNACNGLTPGAGCTFTVTARPGSVALVAVIYDHDLHGTPTDPTDDTYAVMGWAVQTGIAVTAGQDQTGLALTLIDAGHQNDVTVSFGTVPAGLPNVAAIVGIETGTADGVIQLPVPLTPTSGSATLHAPALSAFSGATYRLSAFANNGTTSTAITSAVLAHKVTGTALAAGTWLAPPANVVLTRTTAAWAAEAGAVVQGEDIDQSTTHWLGITAFDGSTSIAIPDLVALPATGTLDAKATAIGGTIDPTNFSIDTDRDKIAAAVNEPVTIN